MRTIIFIGLGFAICLSQPLIAAPTTSSLSAKQLLDACSQFSQAEMHQCLNEKEAESLNALQLAEKNVVRILSNWDEDDKYIHLSKTAFAISRKEFAKYRRAQCEFSASLSGGGAGGAYQMGLLSCAAELNNRRAEQLHHAVINLPLK